MLLLWKALVIMFVHLFDRLFGWRRYFMEREDERKVTQFCTRTCVAECKKCALSVPRTHTPNEAPTDTRKTLTRHPSTRLGPFCDPSYVLHAWRDTFTSSAALKFSSTSSLGGFWRLLNPFSFSFNFLFLSRVSSSLLCPPGLLVVSPLSPLHLISQAGNTVRFLHSLQAIIAWLARGAAAQRGAFSGREQGIG